MTEADADGSAPPQVDDDSGLGYDAPDGADVTIVTQGDPIRSFLDLVTVVVDEAKFRFTTDGLDISAVDPANVAMVDAHFPADGMASYRGTDLTVGMPLNLSSGGDLVSALQYARRGRGSSKGDPVRIDVYDGGSSIRVRVAILRPDQQTKRVSWFFAIDPDSLRTEPDIPDLDLPYRADPDVDALVDAVGTLKNHDHAWLGAEGRTLVIGSQPTANPRLDPDDDDTDVVDTVEMPNRAWSIDDPDGAVDDADGSLFSREYLRDFVKGLKKGKISRLTASFGDEFPVKMNWDQTDFGISGTYMVAPRIQSDD